MSSLQSLLPDFSDDDKKRLRQLGVVDEQLAELRYALIIVRMTVAPKATKNGTKALLVEIRALSDKLDRKLMSLISQPSAEHNLTHALLEERYWLIDDRQDDIGPTISSHLIPRLRALSTCASDALDSLPNNPTRNRSADPAPIKRIAAALLHGWIKSQGSRVRTTPENETLADMIAEAKASPPQPPYPDAFQPSVSENAPFREIAGICYRTVGGNPDPERPIKSFLSRQKKTREAAMAALEEGIRSATG